jgi:hypothetical protein
MYYSGGEPKRSLIRTPAEGPDYHSNWRLLQGEHYLQELHVLAPGARTIEQILEGESDEFVRDFLLFHEGHPCGHAEAIAYATRANQENLASGAASLIRTMVLAGASAAKIAQEMATTEENITVFEKIYFDVRPYLSAGAFVAQICSSAVGTEKRWFMIALRHGLPGVEEFVLLRRRAHGRHGERNLGITTSVMLNRVEDGAVNLEASGIEPGDRDLERLAALADIHTTGLPALWQEADPAQQGASSGQVSDSPFSKLNAGGREHLRSFLGTFMDEAVKKVAESKSIEALPATDPESNPKNTSVDTPDTQVS